MVEEKHLDEDLFKLLLSNRLHEKYASRFLDPAQHDEVDESTYLK
jgi:hypothetical protein